MAKTREIKKRIKAVGNIRRITKTMQMIATAKFAQSQTRVTASKPYTQTIFELVGDLAGAAGEVSHPLLQEGSAGPELTLIITSDRGLCGPYNGAVLRKVMALFRETPSARAGLIELVGKKGAGALKFNKVPVAKQHAIGDKPTYEQIQAIAEDYMARFTRKEVSKVRVVYMKFITAGRQVPEVLQLLPFDPSAAKPAAKPGEAPAAKASVNYEFSPDAATLLGELLPAAVKAVLFQALQEAVVSENVARMVAMKAATDNAGKMGKALTRKFNRARQTQITTELTEIISGAAALD
jgi:F-type H+-transporting ATPase subunit gamma